MFSIFDIFFPLLVILSCTQVISAGNRAKDEGMDRGAHSDRGGLWFGPRLGKRSQLAEDNRDTFLRLLEAADAVKYYYDQMPYEMQADAPQPKVSKKVIFTPKLGRAAENEEKRYDNFDFTPRLGRKLHERMPAIAAEEEGYRQDPIMVNARTNYFSPRLGRNYNFSPRLGRELIYDLYPDPHVRVARSISNTKST